MPLSDQQMKYLALAWQCFDAEPKVDYEKFHRVAGLASAHSARELLRVTKKKLREEYGALGAEVAGANGGRGGKGTPAKKSVSTPSKAKAGTAAGTPGSGTKRGRSGTGGMDGEDVDDDDEETMMMFGGVGAGSPSKKAKVERGLNGKAADGGEGNVKGKANGIKTEPSSSSSFGGANGHSVGGEGMGMEDDNFLSEPFW